MNTANDKGYLAGNSVSATRIDTPIKDLPFSVNAFTDQFIADTGSRDLFDVVKYAPSVTSSGREFTAGNTRFTIRGFDQLSPQRNGFAGDRYVDTVNVSRVEVVKGPASVLYGQIAPGGTVNYITKTPHPEASAKLHQEIGTDSYLRSAIDFNQPLIDNTLLFRVNAAWENYFEVYDTNESQTTVIAPTLTWRPNRDLSITVDYQDFRRRETPPVFMKPNIRIDTRRDSDPALKGAATGERDARVDRGFLASYPFPAEFNYPGSNDYRDTDMESLNAVVNYRINDKWSARANFSDSDYYVANKLTGIGDANLTPPTGVTYTAFAAQVLADPLRALDASTATMTRRKRLEETYGSTQSMQVEATGSFYFSGGYFKPLFGVYKSEDEGTIRRRESTANPAANVPNSQTAPNQHLQPWNLKDPSTWDYAADYDEMALPLRTHNITDSSDSAIYAVGNFSLMEERLNLVGGLRYNTAKSRNLNYMDNTYDPVDGDFKASKTTPQFGAGYKLNENAMLYGSYSESFVVAERTLTTLGVPSGPAKPTTATGLELGLKSTALDGRLTSTVALFEIEQTDRILRYSDRTSTGNTAVTLLQGTKDRSRGYEFEINYTPIDNWQIYFSYANTDIVVTDAPPPVSPAPYDRSITDPAYIAAYTSAYNAAILGQIGSNPEATVDQLFNVWTRYDFVDGALANFWIGGGLNYTGEKQQRVDNPFLYMPAYTLFDLVAGYGFYMGETKVDLSLSWKNISDEEYFPANQQRGLPSRFILAADVAF
ncbi:TonB-dependent receptor [Pelagicoccus sp. SDUM812005]|uniref:TonB-dependent siderophore receptor n=1 Tax=Pelagicoccus sp. SDUM812005 TaxID=3041257 RepID=UPI00280F1281|nr:TonB-dependent receptor [Pelagicoccus sp. SDUM812005]MDQ8182031.1 TonB-dependent receptor [Pelagicoccus sp. SDUM812005]